MLAIASVRLCGAASNAQALGLGQALRGKDKSIHIILNYLLAGVPISSFVLLLSTTARFESHLPRYVGKRILEPGIEELRAHETTEDSKQLTAWFSISYRGLLRVSEARALQWEDLGPIQDRSRERSRRT